jgi:hypothetical protein
MIEQAVVEQWITERLNAAFNPARGVYASAIPKEVNEPAIVFEQISGDDMLTQSKAREYVDFEFDVFAASRRGDRRFPHEDAATIDDTINTGDAVRYTGTWRGVSSEWELTCDRISMRRVPISDDAGDYRLSGGRYAIRLQCIA